MHGQKYIKLTEQSVILHLNVYWYMSFEVFTAEWIRIMFFRDVMLC